MLILDPAPPLKVYYPLGGKHFLLNWYTDYDRGHVLLARSEAAIKNAFDRHVLDEVPEVKAYCEIEIVAPSKKMCREAAERAYHADVDNFMNQVTWRLREVLKKHGALPFFAPCNKFESETSHLHGDGDDAHEDRELDEHYDCKNCTEGIRLVGLTKEEFFDRHAERWVLEMDDFRGYEDPKRLVSLAEQAGDDEVLYMALGDYGHHQNGIYLSTEPGWRREDVLFYYRLVRDLDKSSYVAQVDALIEKRRQEEEKKTSEHREEASTEHDQEIEKTLAFFRNLSCASTIA